MKLVLKFLRDCRGAMAVETAIVAPVLLLLSVGSYQVSDVVARQHALQSAAAEAQQIILAKKPDTQAKLDTIESILSVTTGVAAGNVSLTFVYNCGTVATLVTAVADCGSEPAWTYVRIVLSDTYSPPWTNLGVGTDVSLAVDRKVQIS